MNLVRAIIDNFRSIKSAIISFEPKCVVLLGVNESGKSNILHALALLDPDAKMKADDVREIARDENPEILSKIVFVFNFDDSEKKKAVSELTRQFGSQSSIDIPIISCNNKKYTVREFIESREGLYFVDLLSGKKYGSYWAIKGDAEILPGWVKAMPKQSVSLSTSISSSIILSTVEGIDRSAFETTDLTVSDLNGIVGQYIANKVKDNLPTVLFWEYNEANLLPPEIDLVTFAADPNICRPLKHMFLLAGYPEIGVAFAKAKERQNGVDNLLYRVSDQTTKHMQKVWKEMHGVKIELQESGSSIKCRIRDTENAYNFSRRSDGFKRFFTFLLMVSSRAKAKGLNNTLYLHDEPEIGLHPSGARYLRDELIQISNTENNLVVYSTHSIFMIDRENMGRHLVVKKKDEITSIEAPGKTGIQEEEVLHQALGASIFDSLRPVNILFEGWRDRKLFLTAKNSPLFAPNMLPNLYNIGTCFANGTSDIESVLAILELANRKAIIISDGDEAAKKAEKRFKLANRSTAWYRYDELCSDPEVQIKTEEDFLQNDFIEYALADSLRELGFHDLDCAGVLKDVQSGKLDCIKIWLPTVSIKGIDMDKVMQALKTLIFQRIQHNNILSNYFDILGRIEIEVAKLLSNQSAK